MVIGVYLTRDLMHPNCCQITIMCVYVYMYVCISVIMKKLLTIQTLLCSLTSPELHVHVHNSQTTLSKKTVNLYHADPLYHYVFIVWRLDREERVCVKVVGEREMRV